jgi:hypothetical protein
MTAQLRMSSAQPVLDIDLALGVDGRPVPVEELQGEPKSPSALTHAPSSTWTIAFAGTG